MVMQEVEGRRKYGLNAKEIIQMVLFLTSQFFINHISKIPSGKQGPAI